MKEQLCSNCAVKLHSSLPWTSNHIKLKLWEDWFSIAEHKSVMSLIAIYGSNLTRTVLSTASALLKSNDDFKKGVSKLVGQRTVDDMTYFQTKEALLGLASSEVLRARVAHRQWKLKRGSGVGKASAKLQSALSRFKDYLNAYSGLVDIARQADQQYGGLAYATLSAFLIVRPERGYISRLNLCRSPKISRKKKISLSKRSTCFIPTSHGWYGCVIFSRQQTWHQQSYSSTRQ